MDEHTRKMIHDLCGHLRDSIDRGVMLDQPDDDTYEPISMKDSDYGWWFLPKFEEILRHEHSRRVSRSARRKRQSEDAGLRREAQ